MAEFSLDEGDEASFVLGEPDPSRGDLRCPPEMQDAMLMATIDYWHHWLSQCTYRGRWREIVQRSALVLKLLTFDPTGAIVAAPTCSLPEVLGGTRNWDYRYSWIRDAAFTLYALLRIGFTEEAASFMKFLEARCRELNPDGSLQLVYGIDGRHRLPEEQLTNLEGYRGSRPVRVGNDAVGQLQLDIYGELMDSVYLYNKYGSADLLRPVGFAAAPGRLGLFQLVTGGRRDLGGAGRPAPDRVLQAHVLGRHRPGATPGRQAIVSR